MQEYTVQDVITLGMPKELAGKIAKVKPIEVHSVVVVGHDVDTPARTCPAVPCHRLDEVAESQGSARGHVTRPRLSDTSWPCR